MSEINVDDFKINEKDTGSTGFQVAVLTKRIAHLTQHLAEHKHDHASRRGLLMMVSKRRSLLNYAKRTDNELYLSLLKRLSLRH
ncbi:MAG: 30S ribosomal protein S15 [Akkermansia sp.]|nr:30S ribosomal protein S15 [Akkermansia muciniphila]MCI7004011.1 30S ribosomal protein S15 [Akkermansia muciniphila]MDD6814650.1 30S ribosomal protein S15 [Akkermansia muciniphila]